jgi:hypothetical protein
VKISEEPSDSACSNSVTLMAAACAVVVIKRKRRQRERKRRLWCRQWLLGRKSERGMQHFVFNELSVSDPSGFQSFLRMPTDVYDDLLLMIEPLISSNDTFMRDGITAHEKLVVTLRYLSSGKQ